MKYPKISIITPSFNQGQFIEKTINSVLSQDYPNLEYIVIDGGSTDNTIEILKRYEDKLTWISEPDNGQTDAINKGLTRCTGDIIAYLNSDDLYTDDSLRTVAAFFQENSHIEWLTGDYLIIDDQGRRIQSYIIYYKRILRAFPFFTTLAFANFIAQPSTFWRRTAMKKVGLFNDALQYTMDFDYWLRLIKLYPLGVIPTQLSLFRIHHASKGGSQYKKQFNEHYEVLTKHTRNKLILYLNLLHNQLTIAIYNIIK